MNKGDKLLKNTIILFIGKMCTQFITFILLPIYTTFLSKETYGIYDLIQSYVVVLIPIVNLEIEMGLYKFLIDTRKNKMLEENIIYNSFYYSLILAIVVCFVLLLIYMFSDNLIFLFLSIMLFFNIFTNISLQLCRGRGNNLNYAVACIISAVCNLFFCVLFLCVLKLGLIGAITASIISNIICIIFIFYKESIIKTILKGKKDRKIIKSLLKYSIPLIPSAVIWWVINVSDRTIISIFLGEGANGIYALSNKFPSIISAIFNIFIMSWTEIVFLYINDDSDNFISKTFNSIFKLIVSLCLLLSAAMFIIFPIFVKGDFGDSYNYILPLIYSTIFSNIVAVIGPIYLAKNKTKEIAKTSVISGILNVIINLFFIKIIGIWAAVFSTLISFMLVAIFRYLDVKKYVRLKIELNYLIVFFVLIIINVYLYYLNNIIGNFINLIVMTITFIIINKKIIMDKISKLKRKVKYEK